MYILGISAFYHDSAAVLLKDGVIIAASEEERFTRIKHDNSFPFKSIDFCLKTAEISINDVDFVSYYEKPLLKFERIFINFIQTYPFSLRQFLTAMPEWFGEKIRVENILRKKIKFKGKIFFIPHHLSHAAAGFYTSTFNQAAIATIDGVGEYQTTGLWQGKDGKIIPLKTIDFPNSLGLLYSTFTAFLGFRVNDDEYKVMGLAAYGKPIYIQDIYKIVDVKQDGSFQLQMQYFNFTKGQTMWSKNFVKLFGSKRNPSAPITKRHKDLAASVQRVTEEIYFRILNHLYSLIPTPNLCVSGGVALNALANGKIYQNTPFKNVHIYGAAGDSGAAIGTALFTHHSIFKKPRLRKNLQLALGSHYTNIQIEKILKGANLKYTYYKNENELIEKCVDILIDNKILGWFQGRMEFGPRALGNRSIFANPHDRFMKEKVNRIKIREQYRPFAGIVLQDKVQELFEVPKKNHSSPFMIFCFQVKETARSLIPAIVHADGSCRIQTINKSNDKCYLLVKRFYELTGIPCLLNTSFNLKGEPIVETPQQAVEDFLKTKMDYLVIGDFLVTKASDKE